MIESLLSGGLAGLFGSFVSNVFGYFKAKQEHKQALELRKLDANISAMEHKQALEQIKAEAQYRERELSINAERDVDIASYAALADSYKLDATYTGDNKLMLIAEFIKKLTRPTLTFVLVFLCTAIYFSGDDVIRDLVARAIIALTATCVSWWFADRQIAKHVSAKVFGA